jgi:ABC-type transport system involved in multi-copper enzyme maturation permease subunit
VTATLDYRAAPFTPVAPWRRWWPLAWQEATVLFRSKLGVALFFFCLLPAFVRLAMLLIAYDVISFGPVGLRNRIAGARAGGPWDEFNPERSEFYLVPVLDVMPGMVFALLLSTLVVARCVARDRPTNALELYWTRGISPRAYVLAKWVGSTLLLGMLTVAAPLLLWIAAVFLADDWSMLAATACPMVRTFAGLALATAVWTAMGVGVSTAAATPNGAMVVWTLLLIGSGAFAGVLATTMGDPSLRSAVSMWHAGATVARAVAAQPERHTSLAGAATGIGVVLGVLWLRARAHLRVGEALG